MSCFLPGECAPDGAYISLVNHSPEKTIEISKWTIQRRIDGKPYLRYILPDGMRLRPGNELRIYAERGAAASQSLKKYRSPSRHEIVNHDIDSWGMQWSIF